MKEESTNSVIPLKYKTIFLFGFCILQPDVHLFNQQKKLQPEESNVNQKIDLFLGLYSIACINNSKWNMHNVYWQWCFGHTMCDNGYPWKHRFLSATFPDMFESMVNWIKSIGCESSINKCHTAPNHNFVSMQRFFSVFVCLFVFACGYLHLTLSLTLSIYSCLFLSVYMHVIGSNAITVIAIVLIVWNTLNECLITHRIPARNCTIFAYRIKTTIAIINLGLMLA